MPDLPARANLTQLRHRAKDLLHGARQGDRAALERIRAVSDRIILASAQLALAREYGFSSWSTLTTEVEWREILDTRNLPRLSTLLAAQNGRPHSVRRLLQYGADPNHRDPTYHRTALEWSQRQRRYLDEPEHAEVEAILAPVTE